MKAVTLVLLVGAFAQAHAASTLLTGNLGRWLNEKAVPSLVHQLSNHPRFRGETVRVVAMRDGTPVPTPERLTQELQRELTHRLSEQSSARIALPDAPKPCGLPDDRALLLGVEVASVPGSDHRVNIAMVDRDEGVWVNGLNLRWEGSLTRAQRKALSQPTSTLELGTVAHPIPLADSGAVVQALAPQMECGLRAGVNGRLAMKPAEQAALNPIVRELGARASTVPGIVLELGSDSAEWLLTAELRGAVSQGSSELVLSLAPREGTAPTQRLASVWITQPVPPPAIAPAPLPHIAAPVPLPAVASAPPPRPMPTPVAPYVAPAVYDGLLTTPLRAMSSPVSGICIRQQPTNRCMDVELGLATDAYVFVFHTDQLHVHPHGCSDRLLASNAGSRRYRMLLDRPAPDPINVYAVATREPDLARLLNAVLRAGPGACGSRATDTPDAWFARFKALVDRHGVRIDWKSVHLTPDFRVLALRSGG